MTKKSPTNLEKSPRLFFLEITFILLLIGITARLFYWQVIKGSSLKTIADNQYQRMLHSSPERGKIFTSQGYALVDNQEVYRLFLEPYLLDQDPAQITQQLLPIILQDDQTYQESTQSAQKQEIEDDYQSNLLAKLGRQDAKWISLVSKISADAKNQIQTLGIKGLGFDEYFVRSYPEASMAAHVTGFVGKNDEGLDTGYFGVEGSLNKELEGFRTSYFTLKDALGLNLLGGDQNTPTGSIIDGRDITLTIRRDVQLLLENSLAKAIERYGAARGEIIVMEPQTGRIRGWATWPHYDQANFYKYDPSLYKNPSLSDLYEPGSTFKVLTMAAGIDTQTVTADTICDICDGPRKIGKYTIRTWNDEYHPHINMSDALAKSDNVAMIFVAEKLGADQFRDYLNKFKIGQRIGLDLQEDQDTPQSEKWGEVELATRSFGQGITTNSLQLLRAINVIANHGQMVKPTILEQVYEPATHQQIKVEPILEEQVVSPETAQQLTQMMIYAAQHGEAQWAWRPDYQVAGKTGTSQIAGEGGYLEDKTIASFVGFSPPENPKFVMLVKLSEPSTSPWAAETAAPLWYQVADKLHLLM